MSSLHNSKDGKTMLDLVDKLRDIENIGKDIPLPQIVVVGQQSSGKSSVLHALSGIQFPIDDGLCTQFPTEIILRRDAVERTKAWIRYTSESKDITQRLPKIKEFEDTWQHAKLSQLTEIIAEAKEISGIDDEHRFSKDSLVLEVSGPDQEHLTLIDLPGYFISTQTKQNPEDIKLVEETADRHVSNHRAIVLAVVSGKNDLENQSILEILKKNLDLRTRALGVITAPDAVESGSNREKQCVELIQHDPRGLGYGWHILRNLNYTEVRDGSHDRDIVEKEFFDQQTPWNRLDSTRLNKIAESLPEIQQEVDLRLEQIYAGLKSLGEPRRTPEELRNYLVKCADSFHEEVNAMLQGLPPVPMNGLINEMPSLRARVQSYHEDFATDMFDKAQTWKLDAQGKDGVEQLYQILEDDKANRKVAIIPSQVLTPWLSDKMAKHRGKHQANLVHLDWATAIFQLKAKRWRDIAEAHSKLIFNEVSGYTYEAVYGLVEDAVADKLWNEIMEPALGQRRETLQKKLEELHYPYTLPSIYCVSRGYQSSLDIPLFGENTYALAQCCNMLKSAEAFYRVAVDVFTDNVITLGVECCLLDHLSDVLSPKLFYGMPAERLEFFGGESDGTKERRQQLLTEKEQFEEARDRILPALGRRPRSLMKGRRRKAAFDITHEEVANPIDVTISAPLTTPRLSSDNDNAPLLSHESAFVSTPFRPPTGNVSFETSSPLSIGSQSSSRPSQFTSIAFTSGTLGTQNQDKHNQKLSRNPSPSHSASNTNPPTFNFAAPRFSFAQPNNDDDL